MALLLVIVLPTAFDTTSSRIASLLLHASTNPPKLQAIYIFFRTHDFTLWTQMQVKNLAVQ